MHLVIEEVAIAFFHDMTLRVCGFLVSLYVSGGCVPNVVRIGPSGIAHKAQAE